MSADGKTWSRLQTGSTPSCAVRPMRTNFAPNGESRASTPRPIDPYPTIRTTASATSCIGAAGFLILVGNGGSNWFDSCPAVQFPSLWRSEKNGMLFGMARIAVAVYAAVGMSCPPRASHNVTAGGKIPSRVSTPAHGA